MIELHRFDYFEEMKWTGVILILFLYGCKSSEAIRNETYVPAKDGNVKMVGRIQREPDGAVVFWPGTSIKINFRGTGARVWIDDERGANYFNVIINGKFHRYIRLDSGKQQYPLLENAKDTIHQIELIKRTEWDLGSSKIFGFTIQGRLLPPDPPSKRKIEFFGNSITAGYAIEDNTGGDSPDSIYTNHYSTYGAITARHFRADAYFTVRSGIGVMISWFPLIMPEMYDRLDPRDSSSRWDFSSFQPQVVVVNLMQNDSWLVNLPQEESFKLRFGTTKPSEAEIVDAYRQFISQIRDVYPDAKIICAIGSMDASKTGSPWPEYVQEAVDELDDRSITTLVFPYIEHDGHPRVSDNEKMADQLIDYIARYLKW